MKLKNLAVIGLVLVGAIGLFVYAASIFDPQGDGDSGATILGTPFADIMRGCGGDDDIDSDAGNDRVFGDTGVRTASCTGSPAGDDTIQSGAGNDWVSGDDGDDHIDGGDGNDRLYGDDSLGTGFDNIQGGNGNDRIEGGEGDDELFGDNGDDLIYGEAGNDKLEGGNGRDRIFGGDGDDEIDGGAGNDILEGGRGTDQLTGDAGDDVFVIRPGDVNPGETENIIDCGNATDADIVVLQRSATGAFPRGTPTGVVLTPVTIVDANGGAYHINVAGTGTCIIRRR